MKVLLSAYGCQPNRGSEVGNGWNWAWHIASQGYEVWVLTPVDNQAAIEQELTLHQMPNLHFVYVDVPAWIKTYIKGQIGVYARYFGWQQQAYKVAQKLDREHDFALVHHVTWSSFTGGSWLWQLNKPFIFGPVGGGQVAPSAFKKYFQDRWRGEAIRSFLTQRFTAFNLLVRQTVDRADLVLATNGETFDLAKQLGASRVEIFLDTGLPDNYFPKEPPTRSNNSELRLLWVARLHARKGLRLALESLAKVNPKIPFKLTILGYGPLKPFVPDWIEEFGLKDRVDYRGQVPWNEVKNEYLNSDVFFFTSLRDSCPPQLLEAMAHALPIITLDHHGAKYLVPDDAGIKVPVITPSETVNALAQAVEFMFENPPKRVEMGRNGYAEAKMESWTERAKRMSEYYQQIGLQNK